MHKGVVREEGDMVDHEDWVREEGDKVDMRGDDVCYSLCNFPLGYSKLLYSVHIS